MNRIVEYVFFFGLMGVVGYFVWEIVAPFVSALALAAIIVTICYPLYVWILARTPKRNETMAAFSTTILVLIIVIMPVSLLISSLVSETVSVYQMLDSDVELFAESVAAIESMAKSYFPSFELDLRSSVRQAAEWFAGNIGAIFAGTASTIFLFFIAMIGAFYFFRDGKEFSKQLVIISPLPDDEDELIMNRLAIAVRSVATGTVAIALIQGTLTAIGLYAAGFDRAILFGAIAAIGALIPTVGVMLVFLPAMIFLAVTGSYVSMVILAVFWVVSGSIDNILGPYLMSRGNSMHPFMMLIAVLGGISVFGPIGFIVGPVLVSLFMVLLELYSLHIAKNTEEFKES